MKRICIVLMAFILVWSLGVGLAQAGTKTITFAWEQAAADLPNLREWRILYAFVSGGPYTLLATVPFDGTPRPEYSNPTPVTIVPDGEKRMVYFVATAVANSGAESGYSNQVSDEIDFTVVTIPIQFRIVIDGGS